MLLGEVLRAAADGGPTTPVSLAFRSPGQGGRPATERLETFATAAVTSFSEHLSGAGAGSVSLIIQTASDVASTPVTLRHIGPFATLPSPSGARNATAYLTLGGGTPSYAVTAVTLSQTASGAPFNLTFTTSALPLLEGIFQATGHAASRCSPCPSVPGQVALCCGTPSPG